MPRIARPRHPTALLLIDVQQSFRARPYWTETDAPAWLAATNRLVAGCAARGIPVVQVFHTDGPDTPDNPFAHASGLIRPIAPGSTVTRDFRPDRINVHLDAGNVITKVACG